MSKSEPLSKEQIQTARIFVMQAKDLLSQLKQLAELSEEMSIGGWAMDYVSLYKACAAIADDVLGVMKVLDTEGKLTK